MYMYIPKICIPSLSWLFRKPFERPFPLSKGPSDLSPFRKVYHIWPKKFRLCQSFNQSNLINLMDDKSDPWRKLRSTEVPCSMPDACGLHPDHSCTSCQTWIRETFDGSSSGSTPPSVQQWVQTTPPQNPAVMMKSPRSQTSRSSRHHTCWSLSSSMQRPAKTNWGNCTKSYSAWRLTRTVSLT